MNTCIAEPNTESAILARLITARKDDLSPEAARYLLSFEFGDADAARVNELSELARQGALTPVEEAELDGYLRVGDLIAIMQSRARLSLRNPEH